MSQELRSWMSLKIEHLSSMHKTLSLIPTTAKELSKKKKKEERKKCPRTTHKRQEAREQFSTSVCFTN
jgi:hypothetical protein